MDDIVGATALNTDEWEDIAETDEAAGSLTELQIPGENVLNYMGIPLRETESSTIRSMGKLNKSERVILFQVDGVARSISNADIAREWLLQLRDRRELPEKIHLAKEAEASSEKRKRPLPTTTQSQSFDCDYLRSLGDEWSFEREVYNSQYIGDKFLGRVWLSPGGQE